MPRGFHGLPVRRWLAGFLLGGVLASAGAGGPQSDAAAPLDRAISEGETSLAKGEFPAAEGHYLRALFEGWLLMGTLEKIENRLPEARRALQKAATYVPDDGPARRSLATALLQVGEAAPAVELLAPLAARDPRDVESRRLLAKGLAAAGQPEQAVARLDEASAIAGDDPEMAYLLGTEYLWVKRPEAAERLFAQVVRARPIPQTHILIGRSYRDAGEYGRARAELRAALLQQPGVRRAHYYLGMVALADAGTGPDRLAIAIAEFQEELRLEPQDPLANYQLGAALIEADRPAEALPFLETAVDADPRAVYVYHLGRAQRSLSRTAEAATTLRRALELADAQGAPESDLQSMHYQLGLALRKLGQTEEGATHLAEARRLSEAAAEALNASDASPAARAARLSTQGSPLAEVSRAERIELRRRTVGGLTGAYLNLGVLQAQSPTPARSSERFARAAVLFASAADLDPDFPKVQSSLGVARFNARQFREAVAPLERALGASPDDPGLRSMLAISLLNTETWDKAADLLRADPERETNPSLQSAYGLALVRSGRGAEAQSVLSGLVAQRGDSAELRLLLGQAFLVEGKTAEAVPHLEAAARLAPEDPGVRDELGRAYQKLGRTELAERELEAARQLKARRPGGAP